MDPGSPPSDTGSCPFPPGSDRGTTRIASDSHLCESSKTCKEGGVEKSKVVNLNEVEDEDGDTLSEAIKTKQLCEIGGILFKNNNNLELLAVIGGSRHEYESSEKNLGREAEEAGVENGCWSHSVQK
ncbi:hypothetical protein PIB30_072143 [Stylosanthes scabra]|uniref:Uncharacterized protein n=1 Tax=Stylosanthes scabra TaxID=79078 RepID=A0ABU6YMY5_9FABA|nr:hypothetical protein [Stylosanthes scabra]